MRLALILAAYVAVNLLAVLPAIAVINAIGGGLWAVVAMGAALIWHEALRDAWDHLYRRLRP